MKHSSGFLSQMKGSSAWQDLLSRLMTFSATTGVPKDLFCEISEALKSSRDPVSMIADLKRVELPLASLALLQGQFELALTIGLTAPFERIQALIFTGQRIQAEKYVESLERDEPGLTLQLIHLFMARTSNRASKALKIFEETIEAKLESTESDQILIDVTLQTGTVYFNCSRFDDAFDFYKRAFDQAKSAKLKPQMAIAGFNASITLTYLNRQIESKTWLWLAEEVLSEYHFEHLGQSIELSRLERMRDEGHYQECLALGVLFLRDQNLSVIQRILALQAVAKSSLEQGLLFEAESQLNQCRSVMMKNSFHQFELFQRALELDLEAMVTRRVLRSTFSSSQTQVADERASFLMKIAQARKALIENDLNRTLRLMTDLRRTGKDIPEDLLILESENLNAIPATARAQEMYLLVACQKQKVVAIDRLVLSLSQLNECNSWQAALLDLAQGFRRFFSGDKAAAAAHLLDGFQIAENSGLERLACIGLGLAASLEPSLQERWIEKLNQLDQVDLAYVEAFLKRSFSIALNAEKWIFSKTEKRLVSSQQLETAAASAELVIDKEQTSVALHGNTLPFKGVLYKLLLCIAESGSEGASKADLAKNVWDQNYDPTMNDAVIYNNIGRLRDFVSVEMQDGRYRLPSGLKWIVVESAENKKALVNGRQSIILSLLKSNPSGVQRNQAKAALKTSERTALRELTDLVHLGILKKTGSGRSVAYVWAE